MNELKAIIEDAFENRDSISPSSAPDEVRDAVAQAIELLNTGKARVAEKIAGEWVVHQWLKKAVLLFFRLHNNDVIEGAESKFYDKVPLKYTNYTAEQFAAKLVKQGEDPDSASYKARVKGYAAREPAMQKARLEPDFPPWPCACFYPMNKKRKVGENWFTLPFSERSRLMAEHGASGMKFGGRVSQLITVSVGLDDWEWGVTLWARRPEFLKEIVYTMRFDEASARYAEFGPFYTGYIATAEEIIEHCRIRS